MGAKERERKVTGLVPIMVQGLEPEGGAVSQFSEKMGGRGVQELSQQVGENLLEWKDPRGSPGSKATHQEPQGQT